MPIEETIKINLDKHITLQHFELKDFTGRHLNHKQHEGGFHLESIIVSKDFIGLSLVKRHKLVYEALDQLLKHEIHAFSMKTYTPEEWEKMK
ncbi:MAG: BolA family transcriptional regulator [Candidatus Marinimicrobia bacterium]|nr:BolA family transcriptional regulator [Candidatus Neomarinimicrobiota bacterium]|tara:strand:- start:2517 stop:2792 length:276 start_codon:yes stop_codon:yes gene_type:complete